MMSKTSTIVQTARKEWGTEMTHAQRLLALLIENGHRGVNSFDPIRHIMPQLPFVVSQLKDEGYVISHVDQPDRSTTYVLQHVPPHLKQATTAILRPLEARPASSPTMYEGKSVNEQKQTIEELLVKIQKLRQKYAEAMLSDRPLILRQARALKNAIAQIDPAHPSLFG